MDVDGAQRDAGRARRSPSRSDGGCRPGGDRAARPRPRCASVAIARCGRPSPARWPLGGNPRNCSHPVQDGRRKMPRQRRRAARIFVRHAPPGRGAGARAPAVRGGVPRGDAAADRRPGRRRGRARRQRGRRRGGEVAAAAAARLPRRRRRRRSASAGSTRSAGDRWYIGRRHVEDGDGTPVVVDWRADVATPFYRATLADPFGLRLRRRFVFTGRELHDVFEEDFDDPDSLAGSGGVPDPLLAELGRARTGQMRDIVATIQGEQDAIIRAPLETCLVVQGGPGTGKTAVGLHRAAFLLYEHRDAAVARGRARRRAQPGVPALHQPGAAVARRDVGDADDGRRPARAALPRRRRRLRRASPRSRATRAWRR